MNLNQQINTDTIVNGWKRISRILNPDILKKYAVSFEKRLRPNLKRTSILSKSKGGGIQKKPFYGQAINTVRHPINHDNKKRNETMKLWGQEFTIVDEGLAQEQVIGYVTELMSKHKELEQQQAHFLSLATLSEKAAIEADKAAVIIKAKAKSEAESEAARIIAEANAKSQEMLAEAKKTAHETTQHQVETIHQLALKEAAITRKQAKQQAQLFLIRTRERLESDLRHEVKEAYNRLLFYLQELVSRGNELDVKWKDKTLEICKNETFELEDYDMDSYTLASEVVSPFTLKNLNIETIDTHNESKEIAVVKS